jgi:hypothetical protein
MKLRLVGVALAGALALMVSVRADASVTYTFSANLFGPVAFSYTSSGFITSNTLVPASALNSCLAPVSDTCTDVNFDVTGGNIIMDFGGGLPRTDTYVGFAGDFSSFGTYSPTASGTLVVRGAAVPEPATWAMMLLGFGAIGFAVARKPRVALPT